jgi:hypothetical protein
MTSACICVKEFRSPGNQLLRTIYTWRAHFQENGTLFVESGVDENGEATPPQSIQPIRGQWVEMIIVDAYPEPLWDGQAAHELEREAMGDAEEAAYLGLCQHAFGMCLTYECPESQCPNN